MPAYRGGLSERAQHGSPLPVPHLDPAERVGRRPSPGVLCDAANGEEDGARSCGCDPLGEDGGVAACAPFGEDYTCSLEHAQCLCEDCLCDSDFDCVEGTQCELGECRPQGCSGDACPLFWLELGDSAGTAPRQSYEVTIPAGEAKTIHLANADGSSGVRWTGAVSVTNRRMGAKRVLLDYVELPEGQWSGEMVYLAQFGTNELDAWMENKDDPVQQERVGNALVQRWSAFRRGRISWDEFLAVLSATRSGSWRYPNVQEACNGDACYLYTLGGIAEYSSDLDTVPVPTGASELPMAMNLRVSQGDPTSLVGRIVSEEALQYAGDPAIALRFDVNPNTCSRGGPGTTTAACMVFVEQMSADVFVGGRYITDADDTNCRLRAGDDYTQAAVPWLVPGFLSADPDTGATRSGYWMCSAFSTTAYDDPSTPFSSGGGYELQGEIPTFGFDKSAPMCEGDDCNVGWSVQ